MSDRALDHAEYLAEYDPWADNDAAHAALLETVKKLNDRLTIVEQELKAVKEVTEHLYREYHSQGNM